jgi:hypothetical protein
MIAMRAMLYNLNELTGSRTVNPDSAIDDYATAYSSPAAYIKETFTGWLSVQRLLGQRGEAMWGSPVGAAQRMYNDAVVENAYRDAINWGSLEWPTTRASLYNLPAMSYADYNYWEWPMNRCTRTEFTRALDLTISVYSNDAGGVPPTSFTFDVRTSWNVAHIENDHRDALAYTPLVFNPVTDLGPAQTELNELRAQLADANARVERLQNFQITRGDDPRLVEFWSLAEGHADREGFCPEYDRIAARMNGTQRKVSYTVTLSREVTYTEQTIVTASVPRGIAQHMSNYPDFSQVAEYLTEGWEQSADWENDSGNYESGDTISVEYVSEN